MQKESNKIRSEYLFAALMCIAVALFIVILIVCSSCRADQAGTENTSVAESSFVSDELTSEPSEEESKPAVFQTIEVSSSEKARGLLAVTNLPAEGDEAPSGLKNISSDKNDTYGLSNYSLQLQPEAINALNRLTEAFEAAKGENNLIVDKAYTDVTKLEDQMVEVDLTTGYALMFSVWPVDPNGDYIGSGKFVWLVDNCNDFGYILRYPSEKSSSTRVSGNSRLYRYVGYEHAAYMGTYHLCLEEYLDAIRAYTPEQPLEISYTDSAGDEKVCEVYYVAASDGATTSVPVRGGEGTVYKVSGNGTDGFVITCYPA